MEAPHELSTAKWEKWCVKIQEYAKLEGQTRQALRPHLQFLQECQKSCEGTSNLYTNMMYIILTHILYSFFFEGELVSGIYSLQLNLYELVDNISKLDMTFLWFTADIAAAMLPLFLDKKKKDGAAYLLCIVEVCFL